MRYRPSTFMEAFASQHGSSAQVHRCGDSAFLSIERPSSLAAFFAFCSGQSLNTRIFLRGCTEDHATAYPSLFRGLNHDDPRHEQANRWRAYQYVLHRFQDLDGQRWRRKDLGAVLQHYGIKTPWLDVVRNLYSAIWFATHDLQANGLDGKAQRTQEDYGWISFYRRKAPLAKRLLQVMDIFAQHSSTHLRPHAQHGGSLAMQSDNATEQYRNQDFNRFRVAQIRIPNSAEWTLSGHMVSTVYMFPSGDLDDSFRRLNVPAVQAILDGACRRFSICSGGLGQISSYR